MLFGNDGRISWRSEALHGTGIEREDEMDIHTERENDSGGPKREAKIEIAKETTPVHFMCSHPSCQWRSSCALHNERERREYSEFMEPNVSFSFEKEEMLWSICCHTCHQEPELL
jgi:hypothetical protein